MAKQVVISNIVTPATIHSGLYDFATFVPNFLYLLVEATDQRTAWSWAYPNIHKVTVSPEGVAYPGDASPGTGAKKVTVDFAGTPATVVMTLVDNVQVNNGWLVITKGDHIVAYSPSIILTTIVEPS